MDETTRNGYSCNKLIYVANLRLLAVELKLCTSHLCEKYQSVWGAQWRGAPIPCHGTIDTMVHLALQAVALCDLCDLFNF